MGTFSLCMVLRSFSEDISLYLYNLKDMMDEIILVYDAANEPPKTDSLPSNCRLHPLNQTGKGCIADQADAWNYAFRQSSGDYTLWLEQGDFLSSQGIQALKLLKQSLDGSTAAVAMTELYTLDRNQSVTFSVKRIHLVKKKKENTWSQAVHPYIKIESQPVDTNIQIVKRDGNEGLNRTLAVFESSLEMGFPMTPRDLFDFAHLLYNLGNYPLSCGFCEKYLAAGSGSTVEKLTAYNELTDMAYYQKQRDKERTYLLESLSVAPPTAEFCYKLGLNFQDAAQYATAVYWYRSALTAEKPAFGYGFYNESCWSWLPHLQLCVCYFRLGDYEKSYHHIETAYSLCPENELVSNDKRYMDNFIKSRQDVSESQQRKTLKIVQVAPNYFSVPPENYGGIERIVYDLTEELVSQGHDVYLFARPGSRTSAHLIPYEDWEPDISEFVLRNLPQGTDLIHDHTHHSYVGKKTLDTSVVCTLHDARKNTVTHPVYLSLRALEVIGGGIGTFIYNGIDPQEYEFSEVKEDYLLFIGELRWHKGILKAIEVAEKTGQKLVIAGPVFFHDYSQQQVRPRIDANPNIQYVGPVGGKERQLLLKNARCMIFPTSWEEPFGLVMIEAMACGTPVIALANGAVPEVLREFPDQICVSVDEMADKVLHLPLPPSAQLREYVERHFTRKIMANEYEKLYKNILDGGL